MSYSKLTPEEISLLQAHPYIIEVTPRKVCFSKDIEMIQTNKNARVVENSGFHHGGAYEARTRDLLTASQTRSQLR